MKPEERYERGVEKIVELWGPTYREKGGVTYELAPDFAEYAREYIFGAIWSDPALDTHLRSVATIAALIVKDLQPELRLHLRAALNLGFTKEQLVALITHMSIYGGVPTTANALNTAKEVFTKWDARQVENK